MPRRPAPAGGRNGLRYTRTTPSRHRNHGTRRHPDTRPLADSGGTRQYRSRPPQPPPPPRRLLFFPSPRRAARPLSFRLITLSRPPRAFNLPPRRVGVG